MIWTHFLSTFNCVLRFYFPFLWHKSFEKQFQFTTTVFAVLHIIILYNYLRYSFSVKFCLKILFLCMCVCRKLIHFKTKHPAQQIIIVVLINSEHAGEAVFSFQSLTVHIVPSIERIPSFSFSHVLQCLLLKYHIYYRENALKCFKQLTSTSTAQCRRQQY